MNNDLIEILNNLVINHSFSSLEELDNYIKIHKCNFDLGVMDLFLSYLFDQFSDDNDNKDLQALLLNIWISILSQSDLNNIYDDKHEFSSLLESLRRFYAFFGDYAKIILTNIHKTIKVVEVNERGLKQKHFAYDETFSIGDKVYVGKLSLKSLGIVTDVYESSLEELSSYIVYISFKKVYKFNLSIVDEAKEATFNLKQKKYVKVEVDLKEYICLIDFDSYFYQYVKVKIDNQICDGYIVSDQFLMDDINCSNYVISPIIAPIKEYQKEYRPLDDNIVDKLIPGWKLNDLKDALKSLNKKKYVIIFSVFEQLFRKLENIEFKELNEVEEFNLYYRPYLNFFLQTIDVNKFYYVISYIKYSLLLYLSYLKRLDSNSLNFLIDKQNIKNININVAYININGFIKRFFAYDDEYQIGMPVLIDYKNAIQLGFIHDIKKVPLNELINEIEYFEINNYFKYALLDQYLQDNSQSDGKVMIVSLLNDDKKIEACQIKNIVPYIGLNINSHGKHYIVVSDPFLASSDEVDINKLKIID